MSHGAGLAKAILDATGGDEGDYNLLCQQVKNKLGQLKTGHAFLCNIPCANHANIITTVGPIYPGQVTDNLKQLLRDAYYNVLDLAGRAGFVKITLVPISIGIFNVPLSVSLGSLVCVLATNDIPIHIELITNDNETHKAIEAFFKGLPARYPEVRKQQHLRE